MADYFVKSGTGGADTGASWADAAESIPGLMTAQALVVGDRILVHNTHSYLPGAAITWSLPETTAAGEIQVLCVDGGDATGAALSGTTVGSLTTGAVESTNGNFTFTIQGTGTTAGCSLYVFGMKIKSGSNASQNSADININTNSANFVSRVWLENCEVHVDSTNSSALFSFGLASNVAISEHVMKNCTYRTGNAAQVIGCNGGRYEFVNLTLAGTALTSVFQGATATTRANIKVSASDLSSATNVFNQGVSTQVQFFASNCAIGTPVTGTNIGYGGAESEFHACAAADGTNGANILRFYRETPHGIVEDDQTVYKATGGAQGEQDDGTDTSYSLKYTPSTICTKTAPLYGPWIYRFVDSTGDKTITLKVAHTETSALTTSQVWMEVEYMGEPGATGTQRLANSPQAVMEVDDNCNVVSGTIYRDVIAAGSARTDDAIDDWTGLTSEKEHTLTASVNCAEVGYIRCRVGLGIDTTNPVYVDPKIGLA